MALPFSKFVKSCPISKHSVLSPADSASSMLTVQQSNTAKHVARRRKLLWVEAGRLGSSQTWTDSDSDRPFPCVIIGKLPDDVLLEIFVCVVGLQVHDYFPDDEPRHLESGWRTLVHVCKRWRSVVFSSPRRLDLRLFCTNTRPVKLLLDIWPPLPIYIYACHSGKSPLQGVTNILAALKQHNRVSGIWIDGVPKSLLRRTVATKPFPSDTSGSFVE